jgi:hypothetical protein
MLTVEFEYLQFLTNGFLVLMHPVHLGLSQARSVGVNLAVIPCCLRFLIRVHFMQCNRRAHMINKIHAHRSRPRRSSNVHSHT